MRDLVNRARFWLADGLDWAAEAVRPRGVKPCVPPPCPPMRVVRLDDDAEFSLPPIEDAFECHPNCGRCDGTGAVCEQHPDRPFPDVDDPSPFPCDCGWAIGIPCDPDRRGSDWSEIGGRPIRANLTITPWHPEDLNDG